MNPMTYKRTRKIAEQIVCSLFKTKKAALEHKRDCPDWWEQQIDYYMGKDPDILKGMAEAPDVIPPYHYKQVRSVHVAYYRSLGWSVFSKGPNWTVMEKPNPRYKS